MVEMLKVQQQNITDNIRLLQCAYGRNAESAAAEYY